jgi:hypothetical protein
MTSRSGPWSRCRRDASGLSNVDLARILAVFWQRGETWAPEEPVFAPGAR